MFPVHITMEEFKNAAITTHSGFVFEKKIHSGKSCDYCQNLRFQNVFRPNENEKPGFSNSSGLKSAFEKAPFS